MSEMFFVIKVFLFTLVVMAMMQIKIGDQSVEERSQNWLHSSSLVHSLNSVSNGASKAMTDAYHYVEAKLSGVSTKSESKVAASSSPKKASAFSFRHGLEIKHDFHRVKEKVEEEADKASEELKSEL